MLRLVVVVDGLIGGGVVGIGLDEAIGMGVFFALGGGGRMEERTHGAPEPVIGLEAVERFGPSEGSSSVL